MHYLENRKREDNKTCTYPNTLFQHKKGISIYHKGIHYDAIIDPNFTASSIAWKKMKLL